MARRKSGFGELSRAMPRRWKYVDIIPLAEAAGVGEPICTVFADRFVYEPATQALREVLTRRSRFAAGIIECPAIKLHRISGATMFTMTGVVADREGRLIEESDKDVSHLRDGYPFDQPKFGRSAKTIEAEFCSTISHFAFSKKIYHCLIDLVPRLYAAAQLPGEVTLVLPKRTMPMARWLFDLFRPDNVRYEFVSARCVQSDNMVVIPYLTLSGLGYLRGMRQLFA